MDVFRINGRAYNVNVLDLEETFNILYSENTTRNIGVGAPLVLDPLGTFFGHLITVSAKKGYEDEYDELYDFLTKPRRKGVPVYIVHGQDYIQYEAYVSQGRKKLKRLDEKTEKRYWGELNINIIPTKAQVLP